MQFYEYLILQPSIVAQSQPPNPSTRPSNAVAQDALLLLVPLCLMALWATVVCMISNIWKSNRKEMNQAKQLGQLPCKKCQFFNNNPYIKCAVNPHLALTQEAESCSDYRPRDRKVAPQGRKK
jgi:hypothetical protein